MGLLAIGRLVGKRWGGKGGVEMQKSGQSNDEPPNDEPNDESNDGVFGLQGVVHSVRASLLLTLLT